MSASQSISAIAAPLEAVRVDPPVAVPDSIPVPALAVGAGPVVALGGPRMAPVTHVIAVTQSAVTAVAGGAEVVATQPTGRRSARVCGIDRLRPDEPRGEGAAEGPAATLPQEVSASQPHRGTTHLPRLGGLRVFGSAHSAHHPSRAEPGDRTVLRRSGGCTAPDQVTVPPGGAGESRWGCCTPPLYRSAERLAPEQLAETVVLPLGRLAPLLSSRRGVDLGPLSCSAVETLPNLRQVSTAERPKHAPERRRPRVVLAAPARGPGSERTRCARRGRRPVAAVGGSL